MPISALSWADPFPLCFTIIFCPFSPLSLYFNLFLCSSCEWVDVESTLLEGRAPEACWGDGGRLESRGMHKLAEEQNPPGRNLSLSHYVTTQAVETIGEVSRPGKWGMGNSRPCLQ